MSAVDTATGEVVEVMGEDEARLLVGRVNRAAVDMVNSIERIWSGRGWLALGYESWDDLADAEFSDMPRLGREQRAELVRSLRSIGMSTRAIGAAAGVSDHTVREDIKRGARNHAPADPVTGRDGKTYQPTQPMKSTVTERESFSRKTETEPTGGADPEPVPDPPEPAAPPAPSPRRSPLPEAASRAGWELRKAIERVERIVADDRFPTHREQVAAGLRSHLSYVAEVMPDLVDAVHQSQED